DAVLLAVDPDDVAGFGQGDGERVARGVEGHGGGELAGELVPVGARGAQAAGAHAEPAGVALVLAELAVAEDGGEVVVVSADGAGAGPALRAVEGEDVLVGEVVLVRLVLVLDVLGAVLARVRSEEHT